MLRKSDARLLGVWQLESADVRLEMNDHVEMEFRPNGELLYAIDLGSKWQLMRLVYRIEGGELVTDQPSSPREERTAFYFENGAMVLDYDGAKCRFMRGAKRAPNV
jgi:hypothetical protein